MNDSERTARHTAIVLAAGKGRRMHSDTPKQYLDLCGRPVLYYSLAAFERSFVDSIILVTAGDEVDYCRREIVERYSFSKVERVVPGGTERWLSVYAGLLAAEGSDYVYIHDGARPLLDDEILKRAKACVLAHRACAAGMPVKDTIKIVDKNDFVIRTPDRSLVWQMQTPQVFSYDLVRAAYDLLTKKEDTHAVTDDAMVVERMLQYPVRLFAASYRNIKITTREDLLIAELYLREMGG